MYSSSGFKKLTTYELIIQEREKADLEAQRKASNPSIQEREEQATTSTSCLKVLLLVASDQWNGFQSAELICIIYIHLAYISQMDRMLSGQPD